MDGHDRRCQPATPSAMARSPLPYALGTVEARLRNVARASSETIGTVRMHRRPTSTRGTRPGYSDKISSGASPVTTTPDPISAASARAVAASCAVSPGPRSGTSIPEAERVTKSPESTSTDSIDNLSNGTSAETLTATRSQISSTESDDPAATLIASRVARSWSPSLERRNRPPKEPRLLPSVKSRHLARSACSSELAPTIIQVLLAFGVVCSPAVILVA